MFQRFGLPLLVILALSPLLSAAPLEDSETAFKTAWMRVNAASIKIDRILIEFGNPDEAKRFQDAQLAWERFREAQTHFDAFNFSAGGPRYRQHYLDVSTRMLIERAALLESYLEIVCLPASSNPAK